MKHIEMHHRLGHSLSHARPDFQLYEHLWGNDLIDEIDYNELSGRSGDPPKPSSDGAASPTLAQSTEAQSETIAGSSHEITPSPKEYFELDNKGILDAKESMVRLISRYEKPSISAWLDNLVTRPLSRQRSEESLKRMRQSPRSDNLATDRPLHDREAFLQKLTQRPNFRQEDGHSIEDSPSELRLDGKKAVASEKAYDQTVLLMQIRNVPSFQSNSTPTVQAFENEKSSPTPGELSQSVEQISIVEQVPIDLQQRPTDGIPVKSPIRQLQSYAESTGKSDASNPKKPTSGTPSNCQKGVICNIKVP